MCVVIQKCLPLDFIVSGCALSLALVITTGCVDQADQGYVSRETRPAGGTATDVITFSHRPDCDDLLPVTAKPEKVFGVTVLWGQIHAPGMRALRGFPNLEDLYLSQVPVTADAFRELAGHPKLKSVTINTVSVNADVIRTLRELPSLQFVEVIELEPRPADAMDAVVDSLAELSQVKTIVVGGPWVESIGVKELRSRLPHAEVLIEDYRSD